MDRLSRDILQLIAERLSRLEDVLRVAAVCKQWRSVIMDNLHLLSPQLPLCLCLPNQQRSPLLMQCRNGDEEGTVDYLSVSNNKSYSGFLLPETSRKWIAGSSNGWLFVIEKDGQKIQLLNPLTRAQIPLPSLSAFHPYVPDDLAFIEKMVMSGEFESSDPGVWLIPVEYYSEYKRYESFKCEPDDFAFIEKIIMSGDPKRSEDCMVMAIISTRSVLSFCRPGDDKWTDIEGCPVNISDVIPYKGRFYAITFHGSVVAWDATRNADVEVIVAGTGILPEKRYLVESTTGDLLHVARILEDESLATEFFFVYKLEPVAGTKKKSRKRNWFETLYTRDDELVTTERVSGFEWVELESLGDQVLFLGLNSSLALPANSVPGCRRNCIYFTHENKSRMLRAREGGNWDYESIEDSDGSRTKLRYDMGLYDMEDLSIESFGELKDKTLAVPPIWVSPNPL